MSTRKKLEAIGYIFHRGKYNRESGRFHSFDAQADHMPPMADDLESMGYVRVKTRHNGTTDRLKSRKRADWPCDLIGGWNWAVLTYQGVIG